jgi:thymidylate synthase
MPVIRRCSFTNKSLRRNIIIRWRNKLVESIAKEPVMKRSPCFAILDHKIREMKLKENIVIFSKFDNRNENFAILGTRRS